PSRPLQTPRSRESTSLIGEDGASFRIGLTLNSLNQIRAEAVHFANIIRTGSFAGRESHQFFQIRELIVDVLDQRIVAQFRRDIVELGVNETDQRWLSQK